MDQILPYLLEVSSSLGWIIGITLFFLVLFHVVLIFIFPLKITGWKLVEYVWVTLAFLSVLGLVDQARRYRAELSIQVEMNAAESGFREVYSWFDNYREFTCDKNIELSATPNHKTIDFAGLCKALSQIVTDLDFMGEDEGGLPAIPQAMINQLDQLPPMLTDIEKNIIRSRISNYGSQLSLYSQTVENAERSLLQQILVILTPLFLAAALALRMTKVTGEYRLMRKARK